jgi:hypothetical protein
MLPCLGKKLNVVCETAKLHRKMVGSVKNFPELFVLLYFD